MLAPVEEFHRYRTIWLSDIHLGTPGCQAFYLLDFLRTHRADTLYLVGDILDGWQLRNRAWGDFAARHCVRHLHGDWRRDCSRGADRASERRTS